MGSCREIAVGNFFQCRLLVRCCTVSASLQGQYPRFLTLLVRLVRSCPEAARIAFYCGSKPKYLAAPESDGDPREEAREIHEKRAGATDGDSNARYCPASLSAEVTALR
jgi:hypothetical protein